MQEIYEEKNRKKMQELIRIVADMEKDTFSDPWTEKILQDCLKYPYNFIVVLYEDGTLTRLDVEKSDEISDVNLDKKGENNPIGYSIYRTIADETELCRIAIAKDKRGKGLSRLLMNEMMEHAGEKIFLEVRSKNTPARNLYQSYGFLETGIRKKYYEAPEDDAVLMAWERSL